MPDQLIKCSHESVFMYRVLRDWEDTSSDLRIYLACHGCKRTASFRSLAGKTFIHRPSEIERTRAFMYEHVHDLTVFR